MDSWMDSWRPGLSTVHCHPCTSAHVRGQSVCVIGCSSNALCWLGLSACLMVLLGLHCAVTATAASMSGEMKANCDGMTTGKHAAQHCCCTTMSTKPQVDVAAITHHSSPLPRFLPTTAMSIVALLVGVLGVVRANQG